ncbi:hypothetical protein MTO96_012690 [Rhipicephalus appendiculatus]
MAATKSPPHRGSLQNQALPKSPLELTSLLSPKQPPPLVLLNPATQRSLRPSKARERKKKERSPDSARSKKTEAKDDGSTGHSSTPHDIQATRKGQKSSPDGAHCHKGKLKMPDGTYVGIEERNRYIRQATA